MSRELGQLGSPERRVAVIQERERHDEQRPNAETEQEMCGRCRGFGHVRLNSVAEPGYPESQGHAKIAGTQQNGGVPMRTRLTPALFAALIVTQTFTRGRLLLVDARVAGLVVALLGAWRRGPPLAVLVAAVVVTAVVRQCVE